MLATLWKWRRTRLNIHRHAMAFEDAHGSEASVAAALAAAEASFMAKQPYQSAFWWEVAGELLRMHRRQRLAESIARSLFARQTGSGFEPDRADPPRERA